MCTVKYAWSFVDWATATSKRALDHSGFDSLQWFYDSLQNQNLASQGTRVPWLERLWFCRMWLNVTEFDRMWLWQNVTEFRYSLMVWCAANQTIKLYLNWLICWCIILWWPAVHTCNFLLSYFSVRIGQVHLNVAYCVLRARSAQFFSVTEVTKNRKPSIFTAPKHHGIREEARQIHFVEVREAVYHKTSAKQPPQALRKIPGVA